MAKQRGSRGRERLLTTGVLVGTAALLISACGSGTGASNRDETPAATAPGGATVDQVAATPVEEVPSALDNPRDDTLPTPLIDPQELRSGGPPPDGIPPIDEPRFLATDQVDFLADHEPVLALEIGGEARAYPVQIMIWHEIANDTVDGTPIAVTYCPLCNSAVAYDRRLGDRVLSFGTSGLLYNSALVMYDRQTESLWSHFTGEAVVGELTGSQLDTFPVSTVSWGDWREASPDGLVLSRDTGVERDYGTNPYPGYDDVDTSPFLFDGEVDGRLAAKERVIGIERSGDAVAVRLDAATEQGVVAVEVAGRPLVVWLEPGTASALDADQVVDGRDVGATGVFRPRADGRALTFVRADDGFVDDQTGSRWNILGRAVAGPLEGSRLRAVEHVDTFWFAWAAFRPDSQIVP